MKFLQLFIPHNMANWTNRHCPQGGREGVQNQEPLVKFRLNRNPHTDNDSSSITDKVVVSPTCGNQKLVLISSDSSQIFLMSLLQGFSTVCVAGLNEYIPGWLCPCIVTRMSVYILQDCEMWLLDLRCESVIKYVIPTCNMDVRALPEIKWWGMHESAKVKAFCSW